MAYAAWRSHRQAAATIRADPCPASSREQGFASHTLFPVLHTLCPLLALTLLLVAALPLFLCMAPWPDVTYQDLRARVLLGGGVVYRDFFCHVLPGMVLFQSVVRSVVGWRSEALRGVDFLIVSAIVTMLVSFVGVRGERASAAPKLWVAVLLFFFYFATSEWCHCQTDTWMLLPSLAALTLRRRQATDLAAPSSPLARVAAWAFLEGVCWGSAFLIKPFVALPAAACWLVTAAGLWRPGRRRAWRLAADGAGLLAGGLLVGGLTVGWLWLSGNWPFFRESVLGDWNLEYNRHSALWAERTTKMLAFMMPWGLIHLVAVPVSLFTLIRDLRQSRPHAAAPPALLSAFYLAWLFQANYLQRQFDYHLVPPILLAITLLASAVAQASVVPRSPEGGSVRLAPAYARWVVVLPVCLAWPVLEHPLFQPHRLALWPRCWREGSSAELRDLLTLEIGRKVNPGWRELARVETFLRDQGIADGQLTCYSTSSLPLYTQLGVRPSTRYILLEADVIHFPSRRDEIRQALAASPQRYVVSDRREMDAPPRGVRLFPYSEPVVFEYGRYRVHRVEFVGELPLSVPLSAVTFRRKR